MTNGNDLVEMETADRTSPGARPPPPRRRKKLGWTTRDSQASRQYNLELDILGLRQTIHRLQELRQMLHARVLNRHDAPDGYYVKTIMEYHRLFENGYHPGNATQYMNTVIDDNVTIGRYVGRDMMVNQWERYTKALSGLDFRFLRARAVSSGEHTIVTSYGSYQYVFTQDTLELMFPDAVPKVAAKMLGCSFHGEGKFDFIFDTNTHRVVSYNFQLDFLETFARLLKDPSDLCALFEGARITEESLIGDVECYNTQKEGGGGTGGGEQPSDAEQRSLDLDFILN